MDLQKGNCFLCPNQQIIPISKATKAHNIVSTLLTNVTTNTEKFYNICNSLKFCPICYQKLFILKSINAHIESEKTNVSNSETANCVLCSGEKNLFNVNGYSYYIEITKDFSLKNDSHVICSECLFYLDKRNKIKTKLIEEYPQLQPQSQQQSETKKRKRNDKFATEITAHSTPIPEKRTKNKSLKKKVDEVIDISSDSETPDKEQTFKSHINWKSNRKLEPLKSSVAYKNNKIIKSDFRFLNQIPYVLLEVHDFSTSKKLNSIIEKLKRRDGKIAANDSFNSYAHKRIKRHVPELKNEVEKIKIRISSSKLDDSTKEKSFNQSDNNEDISKESESTNNGHISTRRTRHKKSPSPISEVKYEIDDTPKKKQSFFKIKLKTKMNQKSKAVPKSVILQRELTKHEIMKVLSVNLKRINISQKLKLWNSISDPEIDTLIHKFNILQSPTKASRKQLVENIDKDDGDAPEITNVEVNKKKSVSFAEEKNVEIEYDPNESKSDMSNNSSVIEQNHSENASNNDATDSSVLDNNKSESLEYPSETDTQNKELDAENAKIETNSLSPEEDNTSETEDASATAKGSPVKRDYKRRMSLVIERDSDDENTENVTKDSDDSEKKKRSKPKPLSKKKASDIILEDKANKADADKKESKRNKPKPLSKKKIEISKTNSDSNDDDEENIASSGNISKDVEDEAINSYEDGSDENISSNENENNEKTELEDRTEEPEENLNDNEVSNSSANSVVVETENNKQELKENNLSNDDETAELVDNEEQKTKDKPNEKDVEQLLDKYLNTNDEKPSEENKTKGTSDEDVESEKDDAPMSESELDLGNDEDEKLDITVRNSESEPEDEVGLSENDKNNSPLSLNLLDKNEDENSNTDNSGSEKQEDENLNGSTKRKFSDDEITPTPEKKKKRVTFSDNVA